MSAAGYLDRPLRSRLDVALDIAEVTVADIVATLRRPPTPRNIIYARDLAEKCLSHIKTLREGGPDSLATAAENMRVTLAQIGRWSRDPQSREAADAALVRLRGAP